MKYLIKLATRGRPELFYRTIFNVRKTIGDGVDYEIIISCDLNDPSMFNQDIIDFVDGDPHLQIFYAYQTSKIGAINRDIKEAKMDWDVLINLSDDMLWVKEGWGKIIASYVANEFNESLDCFLHLNDNHVGERLPTLSIMGREYFNRDGYIYHPSFFSVSADAEAYYVALMRGKHKYFPDVLFDHVHPANVGFHTDATYQGNSKYDVADTENYFVRRARLFDIENPVCIPYNPLIRE